MVFILDLYMKEKYADMSGCYDTMNIADSAAAASAYFHAALTVLKERLPLELTQNINWEDAHKWCSEIPVNIFPYKELEYCETFAGVFCFCVIMIDDNKILTVDSDIPAYVREELII